MGTKVLVTGCTGFVGNHVVKELVRRRFEAVAIGRDPKRMLAKEWGNSVTRLAMDLEDSEDRYENTLASGIKFQLLSCTKTACGFLLSDHERPSHVREYQTIRLLHLTSGIL